MLKFVMQEINATIRLAIKQNAHKDFSGFWLTVFYTVLTSTYVLFTLTFLEDLLGFYVTTMFFSIVSITFNVLIIAILYLSAIMVLIRNPIYSLVVLMSIFFLMIIVLISCQIEFLSFIFLIVYIGAVAILFLFVIMMFNLKNLKKDETNILIYQYLLFLFLLFTPKFNSIVYTSIDQFYLNSNYLSNNKNIFFTEQFINNVKYQQDILIINESLYTNHAIIFILLSYVLLVAMIGAIILALSISSNTHEQQ